MQQSAQGVRTTCGTCGAAVIKLRHERTGNPAAINAEPSAGGNVIIDEAAGTYRVLRKSETPPEGAATHVNHYMSCPQAKYWHNAARGARR